MNLHRLLSLTSPLVLLILGAAPARADVFYSFTAFGATATFNLPDNPTPAIVGTDSFQLDNVSVTITGGDIGNEVVTGDLIFYDASAGGGAGSGGNALHGPVLFGNTLSDPTMLTGRFPLNGSVTPDPDGPIDISGTLFASSAPLASPIPEPGSGLLFLTGIGAISGALALRRRASMR